MKITRMHLNNEYAKKKTCRAKKTRVQFLHTFSGKVAISVSMPHFLGRRTSFTRVTIKPSVCTFVHDMPEHVYMSVCLSLFSIFVSCIEEEEDFCIV